MRAKPSLLDFTFNYALIFERVISIPFEWWEGVENIVVGEGGCVGEILFSQLVEFQKDVVIALFIHLVSSSLRSLIHLRG